MRIRSFPALLALLCAAAACDGSPTLPPGDGPAIRVVAGGGVTDTVRAQPAQKLVVEVLDSAGRPLRGGVVQFLGSTLRQPGGATVVTAQVCWSAPAPECPLEAWYGGGLQLDSTDANGRAEVKVALGVVAGTFPVYVRVPALNLSDSVMFTVRPGAPARLAAGVRDTTAYVGATYSPRPVATDRFGNVTALRDPLTATPVGSAVTAEADGVLRAVQVGRASVILRSGALADTTWVTVPPRGTLAVVAGTPGDVSLVKVELDGSGRRTVARLGTGAYSGTWPDWSSTGQILYTGGIGYDAERLMIADTLGATRRLTTDPVPIYSEVVGAFGPDSSVFFSAKAPGYYGYAIWRVAAPGQPPVKIGPAVLESMYSWRVSPAPDGRRLVYMNLARGVSVLDVATGASTTIHALTPSVAIENHIPRWSPRGDWIVFDDNQALYVMRPDGGEVRRVVPGHTNAPGADWSPDGEWLVAGTGGGLELIRVATGERLPLPWSAGMTMPAWKP